MDKTKLYYYCTNPDELFIFFNINGTWWGTEDFYADNCHSSIVDTLTNFGALVGINFELVCLEASDQIAGIVGDENIYNMAFPNMAEVIWNRSGKWSLLRTKKRTYIVNRLPSFNKADYIGIYIILPLEPDDEGWVNAKILNNNEDWIDIEYNINTGISRMPKEEE